MEESRLELERFMTWCHPGYGEADARAWAGSREAAAAAGEAWELVILDRDGGFLGVCGVNAIDLAAGVANLGYWVRTSAAGRGVATIAAQHVVALAFRETSLRRIEIRCARDNVRSQRVAEKLGATRERVLPGFAVLRGRLEDGVLFVLEREGWRRSVLDLMGTLDWDASFDYRAERSRP